MPPLQPVNILLVDDNPNNLVALEATVAKVDCGVVTANSGRDALKSLLGQDFAVVLLDVRMPHLDGFETAALIRARARSASTPIIFLTAYDPRGARLGEGYRLGGVDYIYKPFNPDVLRFKVAFFVDLFRKTTALTALTAELVESKEHFRALIEDASDMTLVVEGDGRIRYASPSVVRTLGYSREQIAGRQMAELVHADDAATLQSELGLPPNASTRNKPIGGRWRHVDGSYRVVEWTISNLLNTPSVAGLVVHARDVTERKDAEEQLRALHADLERARARADLRHQALHDGLTGLPNRVLLSVRLKHALDRASATESPCALLLLDVDSFKEVNDTLGHPVGDMLLRQIGGRLQAAVTPADVVARLGGDEFAVLLPVADAARAAQAAEDLVHAFQKPFMLENRSVEVDASIGIALAPQHGQDADTLLRRADVAMYQAKRSGIGVAVYSPAEDAHRPDRLALLGELRDAIEGNELLLHYQPKVDLRTGRLVGVEALVRWQHPRRGFLPPGEFIPLAEQSGLIHPLTLWVLGAALRQQQVWRSAGIEIQVAVNMSRRILHDPALPATIARLLGSWDVPADCLVLEITESSLLADPLRADGNLTQLRALGVHVSIDDFGTGYSSLASLQDLPVDELKIDHSFVQAMAVDANSRAIVRTIIDLADALKLHVVAEGVEDLATWEVLASLGCEVGQGYFVSPPLGAAELEVWVADVSPSRLAISDSLHITDALQERIRGRGERLAAEAEFIGRKQAETALRASEDRNRLALQAARMGTWDWDPIHDVQTWSAETQVLHGLEPGTFEGTFAALRRSVHPDDWPAFEAELHAAQGERRDSLITYRSVWPDGSIHWLENKGRAVYSAGGELIRGTGTSMDVTERKLAEEALRASEERFRRQYKGFPLPISSWLQVGDDFVLQDYNDAAEAITGGYIQEWVGRPASECYAQQTEVLVGLRACIAEQRTIQGEIRYRYRATGRDRDLAVSYVFVPPRTVMLHAEDITERKQAEQQREAMAQSEKLRALGQMATGIAHDLNQSLMLVASYSDLARLALVADPPDLAELENLMTTTTQAALDGGETVKRLLLFTRAAPEQEGQLVDLGRAVDDAIQLTAPRWRDAAQAEGRPVSLASDADGHPTIRGSPARLRELMTNLIFNAVDALPTGGTIRVRVMAQNGLGIIEVTDSGVGMSAEVQARLFEPFFTTKGESGTGLGLAMVFGIVEQHGGHIDVHSTPGDGSTFRIAFPLVAESEAEAAHTLGQPAAAPQALRILAVDDEPMMTRAVMRMLKPSGHLVSTAASAEEALMALDGQTFDVVVSDLGMGAGMNGWELAEAVRRRWPRVRFMLATGWGAGIDPADARARGVEAILSKPYRLFDLMCALAGPTLAAP